MTRWRAFTLGSAIALSLGIHVVMVAFLPGPTEKGAQDFGNGGIVVSLGPAGREPGDAQTTEGKADALNSEVAAVAEPESVDTVQHTNTVPVETTEAIEPSETEPLDVASLPETPESTAALPLKNSENREDDPVDVDLSTKVDEVKSVAVALEVSIAQPDETVERAKAVEPRPAVEPATTTRANPPPIRPVPKRKPRPPIVGRAETRSVETTRPADKAPQATNATEGVALQQQSAKLTAGHGGRSGATGQNEAGSGNDSPGGGTPGVTVDYYTQLQMWLEKYKRYPRRSKLRNEQGVVLLRFVVSRAGEVTDFGIEKSSGFSLLDEEVREMIQRAQPLPKMPPEMLEARIELLVPVQFFLQ